MFTQFLAQNGKSAAVIVPKNNSTKDTERIKREYAAERSCDGSNGDRGDWRGAKRSRRGNGTPFTIDSPEMMTRRAVTKKAYLVHEEQLWTSLRWR